MAKPAIFAYTDDALRSCLANSGCPAAFVAKKPQYRFLQEYLPKIGTQSIVVEADYVDRDFLEDYSAYYARCFKPYPRFCRRLHFFGRAIAENELSSWVVGELATEMSRAFVDAYLGYVVARPLPDAIVGKTVLRTYPPDAGRRNYTAIGRQSASLYGTNLTIESMPFQEQDTVVAACATVALWSALNRTADSFSGTRSLSPAAITRIANRVGRSGRPMPSKGLEVSQICEVIRDVGLEAELVEVTEDLHLPSLIHAYLKEGYPVLLGGMIGDVGLHAITLNGYSLLSSLHIDREVESAPMSVPMIGRRINEFYAHDDGSGPFSRLPVIAGPETVPGPSNGQKIPVSFQSCWRDHNGQFRRFYPTVVIVPVYHKMRVSFIDVQEWLARLAYFLQIFDIAGQSEFEVWITTVNRFKQSLKQSSLSKTERERVLFRSDPKWIWRCLLRIGNQPALELLVDATDIGRSFPIYDAIWHDDTLRQEVQNALAVGPIKDLLTEELTGPFIDLLSRS